jgi:hypothetical protein
MTQDEIIQMLRASCDKDRVDPEQNGFWVIVTEELEAFAKLVAQHAKAEEREACAFDAEWCIENHLEHHIPERIRARGNASIRGQA